MMDRTPDDRIDALLALAALGELSAEEETELDALLAADVSAADDLAAVLAIAAQVQALNAEAPPAELKARVMEAIALVEQGGAPVAPADAPVVDLAAARERRAARRWQPVAAAAAVAMLVVGGVVATRSGGDETDVVAQVIAADDAEVRPFDGDLGGELRAVYSPDQNVLVVDGAGVATLVDSETYQLWLVADDGVVSVGTFRPDDDGRVAAGFVGADPDGRTLGVTIEPAGGSEAPTLPIVATA